MQVESQKLEVWDATVECNQVVAELNGLLELQPADGLHCNQPLGVRAAPYAHSEAACVVITDKLNALLKSSSLEGSTLPSTDVVSCHPTAGLLEQPGG